LFKKPALIPPKEGSRSRLVAELYFFSSSCLREEARSYFGFSGDGLLKKPGLRPANELSRGGAALGGCVLPRTGASPCRFSTERSRMSTRVWLLLGSTTSFSPLAEAFLSLKTIL